MQDMNMEAPSPKQPKPPRLMRQYELVERVKAYDPDADEDVLNRAYVFAMQAHGAQTRDSGDAYFSHPLEVAGILTEMKMDSACIVTAVMKWLAASVMTTCTVAPSRVNARHSSAAL